MPATAPSSSSTPGRGRRERVGFGTRLARVAQLLLLLLASLQLGVAVALYRYGGALPLPRLVFGPIDGELARHGIGATWGRLTFDLEGRITAQDVRVYQAADRERLFMAGAVEVRVDPLYLLAGKVEAREFKVVGAILCCPPSHASSGLSEDLVRVLSAHLVNDGGQWSLEDLRMDCHNLRVTGRGRLPLRPEKARGDAPGPGRPADAPHWLGRFLDLAAHVSRLHPELRSAQDPVIHLDCAPGPAGGAVVGLAFYSPKMILPWGVELDAVAARIHRMRLDPPYLEEAVQVRLGEVLVGGGGDHPGAVRATGVDLVLEPGLRGGDPENGLPRPGRLRLAAAEVGAGALGALVPTAVVGQAELADWPEVKGRLAAVVSGDPVGAAFDLRVPGTPAGGGGEGAPPGRVTPPSPAGGTVAVDSHLSLDTLMALVEGATGEDLGDIRAQLSLGRPPRVWGEVEVGWAEGAELPQAHRASFRLRAGEIDISGMGVPEFYAVGRWEGQELRVERAALAHPDYAAELTYRHWIPSHEFRLSLDGSVRPTDLNPILGQWWDEIWPDVSFDGPLPWAQVDLRGTWRDEDTIQVFAAATAREAAYDGLKMEEWKLKLVLGEEYLEIFDIEGRRPGASVGGKIQWFYYPEGAVRLRNLYDLRTRIPLPEFAALAGRDTAEVLSDFRLEEPPEMLVRGGTTRYRPAPGGEIPAADEDYSVRARTGRPLTYLGYPFDSVDLLVRLRRGGAAIRLNRFGFAGGSGSGNLVIGGREDGESDRLQIDAAVTGAGYARTTDVLRAIGSGGTPAPAPAQGVAEDGTGKLDLDLSATGRLGDLTSFDGGGHFSVTGADLARIRIFGVLSAVLEATPLRIGTLSLEGAKGDFTIRRDKLHFPRLVVAGRSSEVRASGDFSIDDGGLDFTAKVFFGQRKGASLINKVMSLPFIPIGEALAIRLTGTADDPKWRFVRGPSSLLEKLPGLGPAPAKKDPPPAPAPGR